MQAPERADALPRRGLIQGLSERGSGGDANGVRDGVQGEEVAGHIWASELPEQVGITGRSFALGHGQGSVWGGVRANISNAPNSAALAVTSGMIQRDFVMADDAVVEMGEVDRVIGPELKIHRTEPGIFAGDQVGGFAGDTG